MNFRSGFKVALSLGQYVYTFLGLILWCLIQDLHTVTIGLNASWNMYKLNHYRCLTKVELTAFIHSCVPVFQVRACADVHILLTEQFGRQDGSLYEIVIGGWSNNQSAIRTSVRVMLLSTCINKAVTDIFNSRCNFS